MNMDLILPFTPGDQIFLIKEVKRGDDINYQFEIHTCEELRIKVIKEGNEVKLDTQVKLENTKPLYAVTDCFLDVDTLTKEVERRRNNEPKSEVPLLVKSEPEVDFSDPVDDDPF